MLTAGSQQFSDSTIMERKKKKPPCYFHSLEVVFTAISSNNLGELITQVSLYLIAVFIILPAMVGELQVPEQTD